MGIKTGAMSLSNIIDEKAAKSAKNEEEEGYVTLYRGTTYTRAKEYRDTEDIATKCKLLITPNAGQFHIKGELAAYFTPQRELAEYYALSAAKWENDEGQLKHSEECDPDSQILDGDLSCDFEPEIGGILTFQVPLRCFVGSVIWDRDCEAWAEWVHRNRQMCPPDGSFAYFDMASVVEGPCGVSHGISPTDERPVAWRGVNGEILTQVCIKCPDVLGTLVKSSEVVAEEFVSSTNMD